MVFSDAVALTRVADGRRRDGARIGRVVAAPGSPLWRRRRASRPRRRSASSSVASCRSRRRTSSPRHRRRQRVGVGVEAVVVDRQRVRTLVPDLPPSVWVAGMSVRAIRRSDRGDERRAGRREAVAVFAPTPSLTIDVTFFLSARRCDGEVHRHARPRSDRQPGPGDDTRRCSCRRCPPRRSSCCRAPGR